jgi:hypothetical protein
MTLILVWPRLIFDQGQCDQISQRLFITKLCVQNLLIIQINLAPIPVTHHHEDSCRDEVDQYIRRFEWYF